MSGKVIFFAAAFLLQTQVSVLAGQADISVAGVRIGLSPNEVISIVKKQNPDLLDNVIKKSYRVGLAGEEAGISSIIFSTEKKKGRKYYEILEVLFSFDQQSMYLRNSVGGKVFSKNDIIDALSKKYNLPSGVFNEVDEASFSFSSRTQFLYGENNSDPVKINNWSCYRENKKCNRYVLDITYTIQDRPLRDPNTVAGYEIWIADTERNSQSVVDFRAAEKKINYKALHPEVRYEKPNL